MQLTTWKTEAKVIADQHIKDQVGKYLLRQVYYIIGVEEYVCPEFEDKEGYAVLSAAEVEGLCDCYIKREERDVYPGYDFDDFLADYAIYATDDSIEPEMEPEREEIEHYLDDYYTDHYQRDMPTGDYDFSLLFYAKVNPSYSGAVEDLLERIREREAEPTKDNLYQSCVKYAIDERIEETYQEAINWAYECWEGQVKSDYHWIKEVGRVGRCGGHIKLISHWPETTEELAEILADCITIENEIKAEVKWLESEEFRLQEYRVAFDLEDEPVEDASVSKSVLAVA